MLDHSGSQVMRGMNMLSESKNADADKSRQDEVNSNEIVQESRKDQNQQSKQDRKHGTNSKNHSMPPNVYFKDNSNSVRNSSFTLMVPPASETG